MKIKLKTITPLIISSGENYNKDYDYYFDNDKAVFINYNYLISLLGDKYSEKTDVAKEISKDFKIKEVMEKYLQDLTEEEKKKLYLNKISLNKRPVEIEHFIRTGTNKPFIPGSSLKGYIRNAIKYVIINSSKQQQSFYIQQLSDVKALNKYNKPERNPDKYILNKVFGPDPFHNIMRSVIVRDAYFNKQDLNIKEIIILSLDNNQKAQFKKKIKVPGLLTNKILEADKIYSEVIEQGKETKLEINNLIDFKKIFEIISYQEKYNYLKEKNKFTDVNMLFKILNFYIKIYIESEIDFYKKCKYEQGKEFYKNLLNQIPEDNSKALIQISKHTGWKNKTGNWIKDKTSAQLKVMNSIRAKFNLGKRNYPVFPKTRNLVNTPQGYRPLGWCLLERG